MTNYWVVRAGRAYQTDAQHAALFAGVTGIGWGEIGDMRDYDLNDQNSQDKLKRMLVEHCEETNPGGVIGQFRNFLYAMQVNDIILLPVPSEKKFHIARVIGDYEYSEAIYEGSYNTLGELAHRRKVEWLHLDVPYPKSRGALQSTRSTVNPIIKHAEKIASLMEELNSEQPTATSQTSAAGEISARGRLGMPSAREIFLGEDVAHYTLADEWASTEQIPPETDWQAANEKRAERTSGHQQLVQEFADALGGVRRWVGVFDLAALTPSSVLLAEMKTLDGTPEDERRQVRAAVGQLLYYEGLCLPDELKGQPVARVAVFDKQPTPKHASWMESLNVMVVWQDEEGRFVGLPSFTTEENA